MRTIIFCPYDPAIPLLGIHTEEIRTERDTCKPMFIATLFTIAKTEPTKMSFGRQMDKEVVVHTHSGILLSFTKNLSQF